MKENSAITAKTETVLELLKRKKAESEEQFDLPVSGLKARMTFFSSGKMRKAQEIATRGDKIDEDLLTAAMIAETTMFSADGEEWEKMIGEDIRDLLAGPDWAMLLGKLGGVSPQDENSSS